MPRQPRTSSGTGIYHVMLRGINRQDIFEEQEDYQQFLIRLQNLVDPTTDDRLTDDDIRHYLRCHWHLEHPTDLQKKEKTDRDEILVEAILYGVPLRQLSRLTGISYGVIQRINSKKWVSRVPLILA